MQWKGIVLPSVHFLMLNRLAQMVLIMMCLQINSFASAQLYGQFSLHHCKFNWLMKIVNHLNYVLLLSTYFICKDSFLIQKSLQAIFCLNEILEKLLI